MNADWRHLSREARLRIVDDSIEVVFRDRRRQAVYVDDAHVGAYRLWSVVARPAVVASMDAAELAAWRRNRLTELVGFRLDSKGRMIGEAWVPNAGLTANEWALYINTIAASADRFEYLLTGRDEA